MIVVTAPMGGIGGQIRAHRVERGLPVRMIGRDPSRLPAVMRSRIEIVEWAHSETEVVGPAINGAHRVSWLSPDDPAEPSAQDAYVDFVHPNCPALKGGSVERVVAVSALGRGWARDAGEAPTTYRPWSENARHQLLGAD